MLLQGKSLVGMVMARVPMFSPTGGASAEGALGEHPDEEVIQGLDLPLVERGENPVLNTTESTAGPAAAETSSSQPGEVKASTTPNSPSYSAMVLPLYHLNWLQRSKNWSS